MCTFKKYLILIIMPDIQEAKCFEFTVQILPPPRSSYWRGGDLLLLPPRFISVYAQLPQNSEKWKSNLTKPSRGRPVGGLKKL